MTHFRWLLAGALALSLSAAAPAWGQAPTRSETPACSSCGHCFLPGLLSALLQSEEECCRAEKFMELWQLLWDN